jgi:SAM-dependent methyltransferase
MTPDPYQAARPYYQAELAAGTERFLEPRRESCPWCGSTDLSVRLRTTDLIQRKPGRFTLEQCATCRHIFQNPRLSPAGLDFYYRDFYDGLGRGSTQSLFGRLNRWYRQRAEMPKTFTTPKAWLDVGTGYGHFCKLAREVWPDTVFDGLDQSDSVAEAQRLGWIDHGYLGTFPDLADELAGRYDVISMHHYLEHTREPLDELDTAAKVLASDGYLLIELPDPEYRFARVLDRMWFPWFQPQHQHMIPLDNLLRALTDRGLTPVAIERGAAHQAGTDLFLSLMLLLNVCAPNPRLPWLASEPTRWRQARHIAVWTASGPLFVITYLLDQLVGHIVRRTRGGNTYRVLARKDS